MEQAQVTTTVDALRNSEPASALKHLSPQIRELSAINPWRIINAIAFDWAVIVACFAVALNFSHPLVWIISGIIISGRQHALLVLMHDAVHGRFFNNKKLGDWISNLFCSWPVFVETAGFRANHLPHHRNLNTGEDPDLLRKLERESEWNFPMSRKKLLMLFLRDLAGGGLVDNLKAMKKMNSRQNQSADDSKSGAGALVKLGYYGAIAAAITLTGLWIPVLLLWFLPAFTLVAVHLRVKAIAEHFGLRGGSPIEQTRNYFGPWWERALFYPHNINYHLDHHVFASVPFYNLPKLHQLLMREPAYAELAQKSHSFFGPSSNSVISDLLTQGVMARELLQPGR